MLGVSLREVELARRKIHFIAGSELGDYQVVALIVEKGGAVKRKGSQSEGC